MTLHRFFVQHDSIKFEKVYFNSETSKQITKVLRLRKGDRVIVLDGTGLEYEIELEQMISDAVVGKIIHKSTNSAEPNIFVTLYQALTPRDKFELVLQKATEVGVSKFVPIETKRSLVKVGDLKLEKFERYQRIIQEASEQSERGVIPLIEQPMKFEDAINQAVKEDLTLIAWEGEQENSLKSELNKIENVTKVSIFIGPEGGFEEGEIEYGKSKGAKTVSLGPRILRTETAGIVLTANILFAKD